MRAARDWRIPGESHPWKFLPERSLPFQITPSERWPASAFARSGKNSVWKEVGFSPTAFQVFTPLFSFDDRINFISS